jgi:ABC-type phosphate/phosphonate transport system ATPase subunit
MTTKDTAELAAYRALRADVTRRLAIKDGEPGALTGQDGGELASLMRDILRVCDHQAGVAHVTHENIGRTGAGSFEEVLHRACVLSSSQWQSIIIPRRLYELATAAALA